MKYIFLAVACLIGSATAQNADPWQYRGIHLGAKMSPDQIMHAIGVTKYLTNPKHDDVLDGKHAEDLKHGMMWAIEKVYFELGPRCEITDAQNFNCEDPQASLHPTTPGDNNHGIVSVAIFVKNGVVSTIDLNFDSVLVDDFLDVMFRQFGKSGWKQGSGDTQILITDQYTKKSIQVDRPILQKESARYGAYFIDYDIIFTHYIPPYQGSFEMKILDRQL